MQIQIPIPQMPIMVRWGADVFVRKYTENGNFASLSPSTLREGIAVIVFFFAYPYAKTSPIFSRFCKDEEHHQEATTRARACRRKLTPGTAGDETALVRKKTALEVKRSGPGHCSLRKMLSAGHALRGPCSPRTMLSADHALR